MENELLPDVEEEGENGEEPAVDIKIDDIKTILRLLKTGEGVDFFHYKKKTIQRRIVRRMILHKLENLSEYAELLKKDNKEVKLLYQDLLINVTHFFRDAETNDYFRRELLPGLLKEKSPSKPLRIWVPGCSTGQEAYSIAMLILEVLGENAVNASVQIFATDLSEAAIIKARIGIYTATEVADVSAIRLQRFFTKVDGTYRIVKGVRDVCVFATHNVFRDPPFS
ncbi:MAG: protein-glutamate O-methyltransferase CheR, partial [Segetibacter sp.]